MRKFSKPLAVFGVLGILAVFVLWGLIKSIGAGRSFLLPESRISETDTRPLTTDPLTTPAWEVYRPPVRISDPIRGEVGALVDIVEYGDFQCPYCASVQQALDEILAAYQGKVRIIWKDFPNPGHPEARRSAVAARCAQAQGKFWEYHDYLFANQDQLSRATYSGIARDLGLQLSRFDQCLDALEHIDRIGENIDEAQAMDVDGTPHFLINGRRLDYAGTFEDFTVLVEQALRDK